MAIPYKSAKAFSLFQIERIEIYLKKQPTNQLQTIYDMIGKELVQRKKKN